MKRRALAIAFVVAQATATLARAQEPLNLPPPPPPTTPTQQYVPPPLPQQSQPTPQPQPTPRREPPPRREREREREKERETPVVREAPRPRYVPPPPPRDDAPPAHRGFQMALRTGLSFPLGNISGADNDAMSRDFAAQFPIFVEIGVKLHPMIFLGGYTALSLGGASSTFRDAQGCAGANAKDGRSCLTSSLRVGVEVQVHFQPDERIDPWAGYGIGFEAASASASGGGSPSASESFTGFELARLAGGVDFRLTPLFGIGPYIELAFGTYSHAHVEGYLGQATKSGDADIQNSALHVWPTIGVRGVFFP